jgi:hypothetical protein
MLQLGTIHLDCWITSWFVLIVSCNMSCNWDMMMSFYWAISYCSVDCALNTPIDKSCGNKFLNFEDDVGKNQWTEFCFEEGQGIDISERDGTNYKCYLVEMERHFSYLDDHIACKLSRANPADGQRVMICKTRTDILYKGYALLHHSLICKYLMSRDKMPVSFSTFYILRELSLRFPLGETRP